ncbi:MAG: hypothetical protein IBJ18_14155 [Phycisphaerales bacterium]|nr:hypothetical protein [Phycisphaerales bacterium]
MQTWTKSLNRAAVVSAGLVALMAGTLQAAVPTQWTYKIIARTGTNTVGVPTNSQLSADPTIDDAGNAAIRYTSLFASNDGILLYNASTGTRSLLAPTVDGDNTGDIDLRNGLLTTRTFLSTIEVYDLTGTLVKTFTTGGPEGITGSFNRVRLTDDGRIGYRASASTTTKFIIDNLPTGGPRTQANIDQTGGLTTFLYSPTVNGSGQMAARVDSGVQQIRRYNAPPATGFTTIITVAGNLVYGSLGNGTDINDNGEVAFYARRSVGSVPDLLRGNGTTSTLIASGDGLQYSSNSFTNFTPSISETGVVAFRAIDLFNQGGIFVGDGTSRFQIAGGGQFITTDDNQVLIPNPGTNPFIGNVRINKQNQVVFGVTLQGGGSALLIATPVPARCNPADIADDQGNPLPGQPGVPNNGVNEGDYNAFFSASGFFEQSGQGPAAIGGFCDIADDQGTPKPPFGNPTGSNNGVNEGDYNCFFNFLFLPCVG